MLATAKITSKGQTTIPREVRSALHAQPGDTLVWEAGPNGTALVRRVQTMDLEYLKSIEGSLSEWAGAEDDEAYREL
jgi:AbrB family looped-hinge helix DNA binding protein